MQADVLSRLADRVAGFADAMQRPKPAAPVVLQSVELTRDVYGMCEVKINGRVAIQDNGDVISHHATLDWFASTQATEQVEPLHVGDSDFEGWFSSYDSGNKTSKQQMRDAYAAGMGDLTPEAIRDVLRYRKFRAWWMDDDFGNYIMAPKTTAEFDAAIDAMPQTTEEPKP